MKKTNFLLIGVLCIFLVQSTWAGTSAKNFKFPQKIQFKFFKNGRFNGECFYVYREKSKKKTQKGELSSLAMRNFGGMGFTSTMALHSYIFRNGHSAFLDSVKKGRRIISQIMLDRKLGFDAKMAQVFLYKGEDTKGSMQTEIFTEHKVITFLSSFFVASHRVSKGVHKKDELFNLLIDKSTKIVKMKYGGQENVPFGGGHVTAETILLTNPNNNDAEVFRMRIYKDSDGYCFPVSVFYSGKDNGKESFEIRADRVIKIEQGV